MKAILVLDKMPNSCDECDVRCDGYTAKEYAEKGIKRPSWCPLRPMPTRVEHEEGLDSAFNIGWEHGYNACLEEIENG